MSTSPRTSVHLSDAWKNFILYSRRVVNHGEITVRIAAGEPTDLISTKKKVRFDKPETLEFLEGKE